MALKFPNSMEECIYFTNREIDGKGKAMCWVFKEKCPKCGKGLMAKPRDEKTGKPKIRATEYVCPSCKHSVEKKEYEDTLTANVAYTCPSCQHKGETSAPFKRKMIEGALTLRVKCEKCSGNIDITKKMKDKKKKKGKAVEEAFDDDE